MATPIESFTAVLLQLNVRYKTRVAVKLTGIPEARIDAAPRRRRPSRPRPPAAGGSPTSPGRARRRDDRRPPRRRADAALRHRPAARSSRSSRARSSRCTRAASRRTTPPTSATPPPTSPTTCSSGGCATAATRPGASATSPTSTTTSCARPASSASTTSTWPRPRSPVRRRHGRPRPAAGVERAPGHLGHRRHPRASSAWCSTGATPTRRAARVYFDVSRFERFGQISHLDRGRDAARWPPSGAATPTTRTSATRSTSCCGSRRPPDEPAWESLWGPGRPGWHIECSALALRELGTTIDLHGGGTDLIFPHHECEAAQSEAATGEPFVRHWMHQAMVRMDGEKMSKSLGNLVFVRDLRKDVGPRGDPPRPSSPTTTATPGSGTTTLMPAADDRLDALAGGGRRRGRRRVRSTRSGPPSTTTSTRRPPSPPSTRRRAGRDVSDAAALLGVDLREPRRVMPAERVRAR